MIRPKPISWLDLYALAQGIGGLGGKRATGVQFRTPEGSVAVPVRCAGIRWVPAGRRSRPSLRGARGANPRHPAREDLTGRPAVRVPHDVHGQRLRPVPSGCGSVRAKSGWESVRSASLIHLRYLLHIFIVFDGPVPARDGAAAIIPRPHPTPNRWNRLFARSATHTAPFPSTAIPVGQWNSPGPMPEPPPGFPAAMRHVPSGSRTSIRWVPQSADLPGLGR